MLRYVTLCYAMLRYVTLCYATLRYVTLSYAMYALFHYVRLTLGYAKLYARLR
jgi:hypothetical protein